MTAPYTPLWYTNLAQTAFGPAAPPRRPVPRVPIDPRIQAQFDYKNRLADVQAINAARGAPPAMYDPASSPSARTPNFTYELAPRDALPARPVPPTATQLPFPTIGDAQARPDATREPVTDALAMAQVARPDHGTSGMELFDDWAHGLTGIAFGHRAPTRPEGEIDWGYAGSQALGLAGLFGPEMLSALRGANPFEALAPLETSMAPGAWDITSSPARSHFPAPASGALNMEVPTFMRQKFEQPVAPLEATMDMPTFQRRDAGVPMPAYEPPSLMQPRAPNPEQLRAAIELPEGQWYTAPTHMEARLEAAKSGATPSWEQQMVEGIAPAREGFVDPNNPGVWYSRQQAEQAMGLEQTGAGLGSEDVLGGTARSGLLGNERGAVPIWGVEPGGRLYSRTQRAVENAPFEKGTAQQWLAHLERAPGGTFREEVERAGLGEFLNDAANPQLDLMHPPSGTFTKDEILQRLRDNPIQLSETRLDDSYSTYTLPGGDNYRTVVLSSPGSAPVRQEAIDALHGAQSGLYGELTGRVGADPERVNGLMENLQNRDRGPRHAAMREIEQNWPEAASAAQTLEHAFLATRPTPWRGGHFGERVPDAVMHMRLKDRELGGVPGTFIEESQSDIHQAGREHGYLDPKTGQAPVDPETGLQNENAVPKLPFSRTEDWSRLGIRRAIEDAVAAGHTRVGWTTGEQQVARYNDALTKRVSTLSYDPDAKRLRAFHHGDMIVDEAVTPDRVSDYVGKELADRLLAAPREAVGSASQGATPHTLRGDELKIGGKGMRTYYDQMYPKWWKEELRRLGGKAEARLAESAAPAAPGTEIAPVTSTVDVSWGDVRRMGREHDNDILRQMWEDTTDEADATLNPDDYSDMLDAAEEHIRDAKADELYQDWSPPEFDRVAAYDVDANSVSETWSGGLENAVSQRDMRHMFTIQELEDLPLRHEEADFRDQVIREIKRQHGLEGDDEIAFGDLEDSINSVRDEYINSDLESYEEMWRDEHKNDEPPWDEFNDEASNYATRHRDEAERLLEGHDPTEGGKKPLNIGPVWQIDLPPEVIARVQAGKGMPLGIGGASILPATAAAAGGALTAGLLATQQPSETTRLNQKEEQRFQTWAKQNGISDVDHPDSHYDYRGYWRATKGAAHRRGTHFPDTFKQHGHPTFSVESKYSRGPNDGGHWEGSRYIPAKPK